MHQIQINGESLFKNDTKEPKSLIIQVESSIGAHQEYDHNTELLQIRVVNKSDITDRVVDQKLQVGDRITIFFQK